MARRVEAKPYVPELVPEGWQVHCPPPAGYHKEWLSSNDRDHWRKRGPLKKAWRDIGYQAGLLIPRHSRPYIVGELSFGDRRKRDDHNYMETLKCIVDGMTDAGCWEDDNHHVLVGPDLRWNEANPRGVTVNIFERLW